MCHACGGGAAEDLDVPRVHALEAAEQDQEQGVAQDALEEREGHGERSRLMLLVSKQASKQVNK